MLKHLQRFLPAALLVASSLSVAAAETPAPNAAAAASTSATESRVDSGTTPSGSKDNTARTNINDGSTAHVETAPIYLFDGELKLKTPACAEAGVASKAGCEQ